MSLGSVARMIIGPPHASADDADARADLRRLQQLERARREGWPELDRGDLDFQRFGIVEHRPSGDLFQVYRGELHDVVYQAAAAYFLTERGDVVFLERPQSGPRTRQEREERQAARRR